MLHAQTAAFSPPSAFYRYSLGASKRPALPYPPFHPEAVAVEVGPVAAIDPAMRPANWGRHA